MSNKISLAMMKERYSLSSRTGTLAATLDGIRALANSASDVPLLVARVEELEEESEGRFRSMVDLKKKLAGAIEALEFVATLGEGGVVTKVKLALEKLGYIGTAVSFDPMTAAEDAIEGRMKAPQPTPADDSAKITRGVIETYAKGFMEILSSINERLPR